MNSDSEKGTDRVELLEAALLEYVAKYGMTELARRAFSVPSITQRESPSSISFAFLNFFR